MPDKDEEVNKEEIKELVEDKKVVKEEVEEHPDDVEARKDGWKPEDEYEGDSDKWVSSGEFIRRKSLFDKIHNQTKEMKKLRESVSALKTHNEHVFDESYKKALNDLQYQRASALEEGDTTSAYNIENQMRTVEQQGQVEVSKRNEQAKNDNQPSDEFKTWVVDNKWFQESPRMRARAEEVGLSYSGMNPDLPDEEVYAHVRERMEIEYPDKFPQTKKATTKRSYSPVEGAGKTTRSTKGSRRPVLSSEEEQVMRTLVRNGDITEEEYYAQIAAIS